MTTNLRPTVRPSKIKITPRAVELFRRCVEAEQRGDYDGWWTIQHELHGELKMRPDEWPCIPQPPGGAHDRNWAFRLLARLQEAAAL